MWLGGGQAGGGQAGAGDQLGAGAGHEVLPEDWMDRGGTLMLQQDLLNSAFRAAEVLTYHFSSSMALSL